MKENIIKMFVLYLVILSIVVVGMIAFNKNNFIKNVEKVLKGEEEIVIEDGISYTVYNNIEDKLKIVITIQRQDGIDTIEYVDNSGKSNIIDGKNRKQVAIDFEAEIEKEYNFKVISEGIEKVETINIAQNYIDDYIKINIEDDVEEGYKRINIQNDKRIIESEMKYDFLNYYGVLAEGGFKIKVNDIDISRLQKNRYKVDEDGNIIAFLTIYLGDKVGNRVEYSTSVNITVGDADLIGRYEYTSLWKSTFEYCEIKSKPPNKIGRRKNFK